MRLSHQAVEEVKLKGERSEKFLQVENFFCMGNRSWLQPTLFSIYRLAPHTREGEKFSQSLTPRHLGTRSIRGIYFCVILRNRVDVFALCDTSLCIRWMDS